MSDPTLQDADTPDDPEQTPHVGPTVVGIGASAGGLAALKTFFGHVPEGSGLAFVVVVHLSPEHESHLAELLQPHVPFPVQQVTETVPVEADRVYVIPPGRNLSAVDTHLRLSPLEPERRNRAPVDHFFRTLSATHDGHSVGVVLTGTGSDGALGVREIKERNGLVVVQDPNEAEYDGMPQSAVATGVVDWVLPLAEIPGAILRFAATDPAVPIPAEGADLEADERRRLQRVLALVRARTGRDFSRYKRATVLRRIARRMQMSSVEDLEAYLEILRGDAGEVSALADDLLINVTSFFRDPDVFERLARDVVPALFEGRGPDQAVRVWSVGCATGEEAYSLAIVLHEEAARREAPPSFQVFASDLHERSLERAREGFYPGDVEADVSADRLRRFFDKEDGGYRVRKEVREAVVFAPHNLLSDPPFSKLDLVSCRNVLIYLQRAVQREVVELFHYALRPNGVLVLGSSETTDAQDLFRVVDKPLCLYRKRDVPAPDVRLPVFPITHPVRAVRPAGDDLEDAAAPPRAASFGAAHERIVERYGPPSLLVGPEDRVVHVSARAGRYLVHPGGEITTQVLKLVRPELRVELRAALYAAREHGAPVRTDPVAVRFDGHAEPVALDVRPSPEPADDGYVLVLFDERPGPTEAGPVAVLEDEAQARLQADLERTRQRLQALVEEHETGQEEMRAANEELQSANEELRSTMEELETSKEELQSMNEELQTVNQENRHKVEELAQLSGDLQNLMAATQIATLFLDRDLRIVRFTPGVADLFSVRMADRGRPLADLTHRLGYDDLLEDARRVLATLVPVEREVDDDGDRGYLARVLPYRSADDRIEGVVITFVDITARRESEAALRRSEEHYRLLVEGAREYAILLLDPGGRVTAWNTGAEAIFGYAEPEILGRSGAVLFTPEDRAAGVPQDEQATALEDGTASDDRWQLRADGSRFWASGVMTALRTDGELRGFAKVLRDNTEQKAAQDALRISEARYRTLFESIGQGFALFDVVRDDEGRAVDFRYLETNPAFERQSGLEDPGGRTLREMIPEIEESWIETFARVAETGEPQHLVQEVAAMGRWYEVEAFRAGDLEGDLEGDLVAILFTDVTGRRASEHALQSSEERFRQAVDAAQLGTWVFDVATGQTRFDARALEVFGLEAEANDPAAVVARVHPEDLPAFEAARRAALAPEGPDTFAETHRVVRPDGSVRWVRGQARVYFEDADGERRPVRAVGVVLDVTEQREAEAEIRSLNASLEARVEDRTAEARQLAAALTMAEQEERRRIAHVLHDDLQQQLHGLSMLLAQALRVDGAEAAPLVRRSVEVLDEAVTLTRTLSSDLSPAVLDSGRLQEALDALADRTRDQYGLEVEVVPAGEPHVLPPALRVLVYQAVRELLFNVVKHADAGLVRVTVESVDGHAAVHVEDDGAGFDPGAETAGFGLTSVRNRLELIGGRLEVASAPGEGTRATVVVPAETA